MIEMVLALQRILSVLQPNSATRECATQWCLGNCTSLNRRSTLRISVFTAACYQLNRQYCGWVGRCREVYFHCPSCCWFRKRFPRNRDLHDFESCSLESSLAIAFRSGYFLRRPAKRRFCANALGASNWSPFFDRECYKRLIRSAPRDRPLIRQTRCPGRHVYISAAFGLPICIISSMRHFVLVL